MKGGVRTRRSDLTKAGNMEKQQEQNRNCFAQNTIAAVFTCEHGQRLCGWLAPDKNAKITAFFIGKATCCSW